MEPDPFTPRTEVAPDAGSHPDGTPASSPGSVGSGDADELAMLTSIEEDLAAVEAAMVALDGIDVTTMDGATAAAQVDAIAGQGRFDLPAGESADPPSDPAPTDAPSDPASEVPAGEPPAVRTV